jgi:hypothetical protein
VISLWFIYQDGALYCATKSNARIVSYLQGNKQCAFEIAADLPPYCGIRGQAVAAIEPQKGAEILKKLIDRYLGGGDNQLGEFLQADLEDEVAIRLDPVRIYQWDFSKRMSGIAPQMVEMYTKICP